MGQTNNPFKAVARAIAWLEDTLLVIILTAMILLAAGQILLRNFLDIGLSWSDPLLRIMVLWICLLGALAACREGKHITIDILPKTLPASLQNTLQLIANLFSSAVCALIGYHAWNFVMWEKEDGMIAFANIPAWVCELIIPIGFALMAIRFFAHACSNGVNLITRTTAQRS